MKTNNLKRFKFFVATAISAVFLMQSSLMYAAVTLPQGGTTVNGITTINASNGAIINWKSYSIGQGNTVNYIQPNSSSVVLNRVVGFDPSLLYGTLNANGRVFI